MTNFRKTHSTYPIYISQKKNHCLLAKYLYTVKIYGTHLENELNFTVGSKECYTASPYRESTGFLQGFPCVVILPLHALAVYRV
jgi:hypothetical protein